ncbi:hypothetical protein FB451DRAFT_1550943 [Mycena latifolia]|nr:hypothetical protein FB451DRAFT_1550943 [Mycena latifolia]
MEGTSNPLGLPELVDHCLEFLPESSPDLLACALVSRAWTGAAQRRLFETLSPLKNHERMWARMQEIFRASPYLIRHVRRIDINADSLSIETLSAVCNLPFTQVAHVSIFHLSRLFLPMARAFKRLLSLPALRYVSVTSIFADPVIFLKMWDRCSPSIRHVELSGSSLDYVPTEWDHPRADTLIRLDSLRTTGELAAWLEHAARPFDLSQLKLLSIFSQPQIEAFDFVALDLHPFNLASLPTLKFLRIFVPYPSTVPAVVGTLATIAPANRIRNIVLCFRSNVITERLAGRGALGQLDSTLADVLNPEICAVELEMDADEYMLRAPYFPRLRGSDMIRRIEPRIGWFENFAGTI